MKEKMKLPALGRQTLPRRRFLQALLGLLGGLGLPLWAGPKQNRQPPPGREAEFYRVKQK